MNYLLVKTYNPAYDFFIFRYFKENGINVDENTAFEKMKLMASSFEELAESPEDRKPPFKKVFGFRSRMSPPVRLFWDYVYSWRLEPDKRPSVDSLLFGIFGDKMLEVETLRELESQLPPGRGKLLFSEEEVAADIVNFYKRYLRDPLRKGIDEGVSGKELLKYFSFEELKRLPDSSKVGVERVYEEARRLAAEVLAWLDTISPEKVAQDIDRVLAEHRKDTEHLRVGSSLADPKKMAKSCSHTSGCVQLSCFYESVEDATGSMHLRPSRGFRIWTKNNWEADYSDVIFPQYRVIIDEA